MRGFRCALDAVCKAEAVGGYSVEHIQRNGGKLSMGGKCLHKAKANV